MTEKTKVEPELEPNKEPAKTPTVEELLAENARLKEHNQKVIGEKKTIKADLDKELTDKEEREKNKLKEKEDYKTLLDQANSKIDDLTNTITSKQENSLSKSIALEVQKLAGDAKDITDIIEKIDINDDNIDMENETVTDLSTQIDEIRKSKPYLFDNKTSTMTTKLPNMGGVNTGKGGSKKALKTRIAESLIK